MKRETRALIIYIGSIEEIMLVEGVEELKAQLKVQAFRQISVFRESEIEAFGVGTSQARDAGTVSAETKFARPAYTAGVRVGKVGTRLKSGSVKQRALRRIVAVGILQKGIHAGHKPHQAVLPKLGYDLAGTGAEPHGRSSRPVDNGTKLPSPGSHTDGAVS